MYAVAMNKKAGTGRRGRQCRREGLERGKKRENCGYYIITSKIYKTIKAPHFLFRSQWETLSWSIATPAISCQRACAVSGTQRAQHQHRGPALFPQSLPWAPQTPEQAELHKYPARLVETPEHQCFNWIPVRKKFISDTFFFLLA